MSKLNPESCIRAEADHAQIARCRVYMSEQLPYFKAMSSALALAGNEVRLKILYLLDKESELCPCDLADILRMSVPAISQHLRKMRDGNLLVFRKEGKTIYYAIDQGAKDFLSAILGRFEISTIKKVVL